MILSAAPMPMAVTGLLMLASWATPAAAQAGCAVRVTAPWRAGGKTYQVVASSSGANCDAANVALSILAPGGAALLTFASATADLPRVFDDADAPPAMRAALIAWISQPAARTTRDLPEWVERRTEPGTETAPFRTEPGFVRTRYARLREGGRPIYCFVQGYIGRACYVLDPMHDSLTLIGVQAPPG